MWMFVIPAFLILVSFYYAFGMVTITLVHDKGCPPCKRTLPVFQAAALSPPGGLKLRAIEHSDQPDHWLVKKVRGYPTFFVTRKHQILDQRTGAMTKAELAAYLRHWAQ